jgi:hypothetical protein
MHSLEHQEEGATARAMQGNSFKHDKLIATDNGEAISLNQDATCLLTPDPENGSLHRDPQMSRPELIKTSMNFRESSEISPLSASANSDNDDDTVLPQRSSPMHKPNARSSSPRPAKYSHSLDPKPRTRIKVREPKPDQITYCIVCEIKCSSRTPYSNHQGFIFEDVPYLRGRTKDRGPHLDGIRPIPNLSRYLSDRGAAFVVIRRYFCSRENLTIPLLEVEELPHPRKEGKRHHSRSTPQRIPEVREPEIYLEPSTRKDIDERLHVHSLELIDMIQSVAEFHPGVLIGDDDGQPVGPLEMDFPYTFIFHHRSKLKDRLEDADEGSRPPVSTLLEYCEASQGDKYTRADDLFKKGNASREFHEFIFRINEPIVHQEKDACSAFIARSITYVDWRTVSFDLWSWCSNGKELKRKKKIVVMQWPKEDGFQITSLVLHPLRYADPTKYELLLNQGRAYWNFRYQHKVAYSGWDVHRDQDHVSRARKLLVFLLTSSRLLKHEARFMIDQTTYHRLHPHGAAFSFSRDPILQYDIYPSEIELGAELTDLDYILCPHIVQGFFLKEKQWGKGLLLKLDIIMMTCAYSSLVSLYVNRIEPVKWNKEAFERLVLPPRTKELLKALLVHNGSKGSEQRGFWGGKRQDLIAGKGTGLIVLLHGGPGTGKTLTAGNELEPKV